MGSSGQLTIPQAFDSEIIVLGAILMEPAYAYPQVTGSIQADEFFTKRHELIYLAMQTIATDHGVDQITLPAVQELLNSRGQLNEIGGLHKLQELVNAVDNPFALDTHLWLIHQATVRRKGMQAGREIISSFADPATSVDQAITESNAKVSQVSGMLTAERKLSVTEQLLEWHDNPAAIRGLRTGLLELDVLIGGFENNAFAVLLGYSGSGKSTLMQQIALFMQEYGFDGNGARGLLVPTEMTKEQWRMRMTAQLLGVSYSVLRKGGYRNREMLEQTSQYVENLPFLFVEKAQPTGAEVLSAVRYHNPDFVIIDGLRDMSGEYQTELANITANINALHEIQRGLGKVVLCTHQMNNDVKYRKYKRPNPRDAYGAPTALYAAATHYLTLYRPYALVESGEVEIDDVEKLKTPRGVEIDDPDCTSLMIAKDRFGENPGAEVFLEFMHSNGRHGFQMYKKGPLSERPDISQLPETVR